MKRKGARSFAFSLGELVVVVAITAVGVLLLTPALSQTRQESLAFLCGENLRAVGEAYGLWAADNGGFLPPRCRAASSTCQLRQVDVGWLTKAQVKSASIPYAGQHDHGLRIVGNAPVTHTAPDPPTPGNTAHYIDANDRPLNRYVVPNWQCGRRFDVTRCPADINTLRAPNQSPYPKGLFYGAIGSSFDIYGTSYGTNIAVAMPWRGHGPWAHSVEVASNQQAGPNFNPQHFYGVSRYVMMLDLASFHENWEEWLDQFEVGHRSGVGAWHESDPADAWQRGNALFGDNHVTYGAYYVRKARATLQPINDYVKAEWSLYPLRYVPASGS